MRLRHLCRQREHSFGHPGLPHAIRVTSNIGMLLPQRLERFALKGILASPGDRLISHTDIDELVVGPFPRFFLGMNRDRVFTRLEQGGGLRRERDD